MKRIIATVLILAGVGLQNIATAQTAPSGQLPPTNPATNRLSSTVDGIDIPYDVLNYIQTEYVGQTVTQANRITRDGKPAYRLRVDHDDVASDYESFYLVYDASWKLISGKEAIQQPATSSTQPKQGSTKEDKKTEQSSPSNHRGRH
jgi:hypothetical protein